MQSDEMGLVERLRAYALRFRAANGEHTSGTLLADEAAAAIERLVAETAGMDELMTAQNIIVRAVWDLIGGEDPTRADGQNLVARVRDVVAERDEARDNAWPFGKRPNPVVGHTIGDGFAVYGDEKSIKRVSSALHEHDAMMPARIERIRQEVARAEAAEAQRDRLKEALTEISSPTQTDKLLWWQIRARQALGDT